MRYLKNLTLSRSSLRAVASCISALFLLVSIGCKEPTLEDKLDAQVAQYDEARAELATYAAKSDEPLPYSWWEEQCDPGQKFRLTEQNTTELRQFLKRRIDRAREENMARSVLDLDRIRKDGKVREFCEALPKGGLLHVHPNGTLDRETVARLLALVNPKLDRKKLNKEVFAFAIAAGRDEMAKIKDPRESFNYNELSEEDQIAFQEFYFLPEEERDFVRFMSVFALVNLLEDSNGVKVSSEIYEAFFRRCQRLGIKYVEARIGYKADDDEKPEQIVSMTEMGLKYGVTVRWIYSFSRTEFAEDNLQRLKKFLEAAPTELIRGIDLLGPEEEFPAFEAGHLVFGYIENELRKDRVQLKRTFHAAGLGRPANIRDALAFGVERIGHAARANQDPLSMYYAATLEAGLEVNLVSNYKLRYHDDYSTHPFLDLLRLGVKASLSTDDEGILQTDIIREFETAISNTDINYEEVKQLSFNSIETSFAEPSVRDSLMNQLESEFSDFEKQWGDYSNTSRPTQNQ